MRKEPKDTYRYLFRIGGLVAHMGITKDPERREREHLLEYPDGHFKVVGRQATEEAAREWEKQEWRKLREGNF